MTSFEEPTERLVDRDSDTSETEARRGSNGHERPKLTLALLLVFLLAWVSWVSATPLHYKSADNVRTLTNHGPSALLDKSLVSYSNRTAATSTSTEGALRRSSRTSGRRTYQGAWSPSNYLKAPRLSGEAMPVCSHVGDYTNEISAKAYLAGTVFEGKARSKSKVSSEGSYAVTFVVQRVHKDQTSRLNPTPLRLRSQVRLTLSEKPRVGKLAECDQSYDIAPARPGELVRAHIKQGRRYIVFVNGVGPHNYTVLGEPVLQRKKTVQAVKDVLCPKCGEFSL